MPGGYKQKLNRGGTACRFFSVQKASALAVRGSPLPDHGLPLKWAVSNPGSRDNLEIYLLPSGSFHLDRDFPWEAV